MVNRIILPSTNRSEHGAALFIALIALVALSLAGIALVRSVDTTNVIAGNLTFRQAALHATDVGVEKALYVLNNTILTSSLDATYPTGAATGGFNYYPTMQDTDDRGIPNTINWANVAPTTVNSSYKVKYVIDRLCEGPAPVTDIQGKCSATEPTGGGSKKPDTPVFSGSAAVYYRVTVKVEGPRNTSSFVQVLLTR